jgi:hypothetical protein
MKTMVTYCATVHEMLVVAVRKGNPKSTAARLAGIHPDTLWDWLRLSKSNPAKYPHLVQLAEDLEQAKAEIDAEMLAHVLAAPNVDPKHWTAAAWFLERTSPEHFSKQDKVEIEAGDSPLVQLNQVVLELDNSEARELSRKLLRSVIGSRSNGEALELDPANVTEDGDDNGV